VTSRLGTGKLLTFFTVYRIIVCFYSNDLSLLQSSKEDIMDAVLAMSSTRNPSTPFRIITINSSNNSSSLAARRSLLKSAEKNGGKLKKWREKVK
jgi:hypothetical protein